MSARKLTSAVGWALSVLVFMLLAESGSAFAASTPTIVRAWSENVVYSSAVLKAEVDPNEAETTYRFEYGTDVSYGRSIPVPDGSAGSGSEAVRVAQDIGGLQANTTYHYRVVAVNSEGTSYGPDKTFTTFAHASAEGADTCPNAAYRAGASANLPDCRAYEMVSPVDKNGANVIAEEYGGFVSSTSGERVMFGAANGMGDTKGSGFGGFTQYVASRGSDRWSSKGIMPTPAQGDPLQLFVGATKVYDFSDQLDRGLVVAYDLPGMGTPPKMENLYLEDTVENRVLEAATRFEGFEEPVFFFTWGIFPTWGGSSADLGVTTFQMRVNLVPQAKGSGTKVYMLDHGHVKLASILPDGALPAEASLVRDPHGVLAYKDTVSRDGSRIMFYATPEGGEQQLYMRKDGASTVLVSESEASEPSVAQNPAFLAASPDDTKVVFATPTRLLDADPGGSGAALYLYSDSPNPQSESNLTFIARVPAFGTEMTTVKAMSEDGSHIYFASEYAEGLPSTTGGVALYIWDKGQIKQISPQPGAPELRFRTEEEAITSPDGRRLVFKNLYFQASNYDISSPGYVYEYFLYDEGTDTLKCISCPTTGAAITSGVEAGVEGTLPANPAFLMDQMHRFYSRDGRFVFFNTSEGLVPQDVNKQPDAYEYNTETGKVSLLSTGTGEIGTWFVEASADGRDVFLATRQQLSRWDPDKLDDLYDARIGGGLPEPPVPRTPCDGDACQGVPSTAPSFNTASEFKGIGNPIAGKATGKVLHLTRVQRLKRALASCKKMRSRSKQKRCEATTRKRFAVKPAKRPAQAGR